MASARSSGMAAGQLETLYSLGAAGSLTDSQLLESFLTRDDPAASIRLWSVTQLARRCQGLHRARIPRATKSPAEGPGKWVIVVARASRR